MTYLDRFAEEAPRLDEHEAALGLRMVGWLLLAHDALCVAFFAPASTRDGSRLFTAWSVAQGVAGISLVVAGRLKEERAAARETVKGKSGADGRRPRAA